MESRQSIGVRIGKAYWRALLIASLLLPAGSLRAQQQPQQQPTQPPQIGVQVNVVNVLATVRDKHGAIVANLGKDDFVLQEDGRPQTIAYFTRETDQPLSLGLLVDTSKGASAACLTGNATPAAAL